MTAGGGNLYREKPWVFLLIKGSLTKWSQGLRLASLFCEELSCQELFGEMRGVP